MKKQALLVALFITGFVFSGILIYNALRPDPVVANLSPPPRTACGATLTITVRVAPGSDGDKFIVSLDTGNGGGK